MSSTLRQLSAIYLTAASAFVVMIALSEHPDWARASREAGVAVKDVTVATALAANEGVLKPGFAFARDKGGDALQWAANQISPPPRVAKNDTQKSAKPAEVAKNAPKAAPSNPSPQIARKESAPVERETEVARNTPSAAQEPPVAMAENAQPLRPEIAEERAPSRELAQNDRDIRPLVSRASPGPGELVRVAERLKASLSKDLLENFELFLYVSKADTGVLSQRMYVFAKKPGGDLNLLYNWPVSTGRERWELDVHGKKQNSFTPQGYYELDPGRMHARYHSSQWNQPMPYAMFFNWEQNGYQTGLAIHGANGNDIALLGSRASAGCVRLAPENARLLFNLIRQQYTGLAPKFAYDRRTASMANNGLLLHDKGGKLVFDDGYKVLVFIENYGGDDVLAALF